MTVPVHACETHRGHVCLNCGFTPRVNCVRRDCRHVKVSHVPTMSCCDISDAGIGDGSAAFMEVGAQDSGQPAASDVEAVPPPLSHRTEPGCEGPAAMSSAADYQCNLLDGSSSRCASCLPSATDLAVHNLIAVQAL